MRTTEPTTPPDGGSYGLTCALDVRRPFKRSDALAAGITPKMLRGSRFRRLFRGVYIDSRVPVDDPIRTVAALLLHTPSAFASHFSAARHLRLPVPHAAEEHVSVFEQKDRRSQRGLRSHLAPSCVRVTKVRGVRVSSAVDTFLALAPVLSMVDLVIVGDALVRLGLATERELRARAENSHERGAIRARTAAALVRRGVDSPMETRLRLLIVLAGLPEPEVNRILRDAGGDWVIRMDLSYPWLKLMIEYDGRQHAHDVGQWNRDLERREELDRLGWRLLVVTAKGIFRHPDQTLLRLHSALRDHGCTDLPSRLSDEWRRHFPVAR